MRYLLALCLTFFLVKPSLAQLSLKHTSWTTSAIGLNGEKLALQFLNDTLKVVDFRSDHTSFNSPFFEYKNTLKLLAGPEKGNYEIIYKKSGQQLVLKLLGNKVKGALSGHNFVFVPDKSNADRDWLTRDPATDSIAGISLYKAYQLLKGRVSKRVIVAVIDNGFEVDHEDLKNVIWTNKKEIPGNGLDDDHNGYIDDVHGWNFRSSKTGILVPNELAAATQFYLSRKKEFEHEDTLHLNKAKAGEWIIYKKARSRFFEGKDSKDSSDMKFAYNVNYNSGKYIGDGWAGNRYYGSPVIKGSEQLSHGTHVAGIIGAQRNNGKGIDGIADNVTIMPIVATTGIGDERDKDVANAIRYAVNNGAKIINMSFSKRYSPEKNLVDDAIKYAEKHHVLIIHAAGNEGNNIDTAHYYPIPFYNNGKKASNFITVGWNRPLFNERLAHPNSNYGINVDVFAPGSDIFSLVPGNTYDYKSGSSMSTPVVSGVAALLLSYFPKLTLRQVKYILVNSGYKPLVIVNRPGSKVKVPFSNVSASGKIVNAYNAVKMAIAMEKKPTLPQASRLWRRSIYK